MRQSSWKKFFEDRQVHVFHDVPMILKRPTFERKSPTAAYGADLGSGRGADLMGMGVKPSWLVPFEVPFEVPFVAVVPLALPFEASSPLHEVHMVATIDYEVVEVGGWRVRGGI
jgi:hypothetical protein